MTNKRIFYDSPVCLLFAGKNVLDTTTNNGITCVWTAEITDDCKSINYWWKFNWDELKKEGVEELSGYIIVARMNPIESTHFDVVLTSVDQVVEGTMKTPNGYLPALVFQYYLTPKRTFQFDELSHLFMASEQTDAILVVDGKKLHVNKAQTGSRHFSQIAYAYFYMQTSHIFQLLSFHSEYFRALFSSNFKEGTMDEIPIGDVTYEDFGYLLSIIHPQSLFPNDKNAEKLLELADRFLMPFVVRNVENHLLKDSKLDKKKMMWLADKYSMPKLLEKSISEMDSLREVKMIKNSPEFKDFSDKTLAALFNRAMQFVPDFRLNFS